jgi:hypothetical protein
MIVIFLSACGGSIRSDDIAAIEPANPPTASSLPPTVTLNQSAPSTEPAAAGATPVPANPPADAPAASAAVAGPAISFKLSGGIVGFCDDLTIDSAGNYILRRSCDPPPEISGTLIPPDLAALTAWIQNTASFQIKSEDNPGGPDNMATELIFTGQGSTPADEVQQKAIFDWVNSLLIRIRPQAIAPPPSPEPLVIGPEGLCPDITRPAVLVIDFERPGGVNMIDPATQAVCPFQLNQPPYGRITTAGGKIYYAVYDPEAKTVTVWQLDPGGQQTPLSFTTVNMAVFGPFNFTVSGDGSKIAWARAIPGVEGDSPLYRNDLWAANMDGSAQVKLLDQVEYELSYVEPVRFGADQSTLFYALQLDGLGGPVFTFSGRYNSMYSLPGSGGEPRLLFACPADQPICIGDISPDGSALAYVQSGQGVVVLGSDGQILSMLTPPASDYAGSPVFGPSGNLAFVSATLAQTGEQALPQANPGYISLVAPPYTGEVKTLLSDNTIINTWVWLDENRLLYGAMDEAANIGTAIVTLDGQSLYLSPNFALGVLR